ncbi:MAG: TetR/AcrR family transcriptional regulator [Stellaceae bacterium]
MPSPTPKRPPARNRKRRATYHHGRLREALIEATLRLIEEEGPETVTVRAAAKRAGVSSGAPFRHFPTRSALMTAVAEQAMSRFRAEIDAALAEAAGGDPLRRFAALGEAYLRWATRNPTHFRVISTRSLIDFDGSPALRRDNEAIRRLMDELLLEARRSGELRPAEIGAVSLAGRALVYGLARMLVDGHFAQWAEPGEAPEEAMRRAFDLFVRNLARDPPAGSS